MEVQIMNKKLLTILFIAVFLIVSASFVCAEGETKSIPVKIIWDDADHTSDRPAQITVKLTCNDSVVDSALLSESNSWATTFNVQDDGSTYKVQSETPTDYSTKINEDGQGFLITNKIIADKLSTSETESPIEETNTEDTTPTNSDGTSNGTSDGESNTNDANKTNETEDTNKTDNENKSQDTTSNNDKTKDTNQTKKPEQKVQKIVQKVQKSVKKTKPVQKNNKTVDPAKLKHTGLPIIALVLVVIIVAFIPIIRRKK